MLWGDKREVNEGYQECRERDHLSVGETLGTGTLSRVAKKTFYNARTIIKRNFGDPRAGFCIAMIVAIGLMTRLEPYRYAPDQASVSPSDA